MNCDSIKLPGVTRAARGRSAGTRKRIGMDPSLVPKVLATIEARGYGNGRPLPTLSGVTAAISSTRTLPAWAAYLGDKSDAPSMADDFKGESCPAPSSITIMRSAVRAREALAALAAAAPGAAPPLATTGKRFRETAGTMGSISGGAASATPSTGDGRLHVLAKRPRGRPRRIPVQPGETGDIAISAAADMGEPKLMPASRAVRDRDLVARLASEYDSDEGGDADYEVESEEPSAPPLSAPQLPGSVGRGQHLPKGVTDVLVSWVIEHKKNPYPTNGALQERVAEGPAPPASLPTPRPNDRHNARREGDTESADRAGRDSNAQLLHRECERARQLELG